jgi:hypothetical protein
MNGRYSTQYTWISSYGMKKLLLEFTYSEDPLPPLPYGEVVLDKQIAKDVDTLFHMMHTDSHFYRSWLVSISLFIFSSF